LKVLTKASGNNLNLNDGLKGAVQEARSND